MHRLAPLPKTILALACLAAIGWACHTILQSPPLDMDRKAEAMHQQGGVAMARLATRIAGETGALLVLEPAEDGVPDSEKRRWMAGQLAAFYRKLGSRMTVVAREKLSVSPSRETMVRGARTGLTLTCYRELLARHPQVNAVVSFVGEPCVSAPELESLNVTLPPMICLSHDGTNLPLLMKKGLVAAAIVPRHEAIPVDSLRSDWFPMLYQEITPETVDAWAVP